MSVILPIDFSEVRLPLNGDQVDTLADALNRALDSLAAERRDETSEARRDRYADRIEDVEAVVAAMEAHMVGGPIVLRLSRDGVDAVDDALNRALAGLAENRRQARLMDEKVRYAARMEDIEGVGILLDTVAETVMCTTHAGGGIGGMQSTIFVS